MHHKTNPKSEKITPTHYLQNKSGAPPCYPHSFCQIHGLPSNPKEDGHSHRCHKHTRSQGKGTLQKCARQPSPEILQRKGLSTRILSSRSVSVRDNFIVKVNSKCPYPLTTSPGEVRAGHPTLSLTPPHNHLCTPINCHIANAPAHQIELFPAFPALNPKPSKTSAAQRPLESACIQ